MTGKSSLKQVCLAMFVAIGFLGCDKEVEECVQAPDVSGHTVDIQFEQLQDSLVNVHSKKELVALLTREPVLRDYVFRRTEYPNDSVFINELYDRFSNPYIDTLLMETHRVFGDLSDLHRQFQDAFTILTHYYPDFKAPKIQTVISGLDTDMLVTDSLIVVSLDFYLGRGAKYRPKMYEYLLRKYDPDDIVPSAMLIFGISDRFNASRIEDKTVLADMMVFGKAFYFAKHMLPCVPDSVLIWYTPEEIKGARANQDLIWARFIESQVLFATSQVVKKDYLSERPITSQVGEKCPGRIAQFVGWQIINSYMSTHPDVTLPQLMDLNNAPAIFKESQYKPKRR